MPKLIASRGGILKPIEALGVVLALVCAVRIVTLPSATFIEPAAVEASRELTIELRRDDFCEPGAEQCPKPTFTQIFARYDIPPVAQFATLAEYGNRREGCANPNLERSFGEKLTIIFPAPESEQPAITC